MVTVLDDEDGNGDGEDNEEGDCNFDRISLSRLILFSPWGVKSHFFGHPSLFFFGSGDGGRDESSIYEYHTPPPPLSQKTPRK